MTTPRVMPGKNKFQHTTDRLRSKVGIFKNFIRPMNPTNPTQSRPNWWVHTLIGLGWVAKHIFPHYCIGLRVVIMTTRSNLTQPSKWCQIQFYVIQYYVLSLNHSHLIPRQSTPPTLSLCLQCLYLEKKYI